VAEDGRSLSKAQAQHRRCLEERVPLPDAPERLSIECPVGGPGNGSVRIFVSKQMRQREIASESDTKYEDGSGNNKGRNQHA
jgi:hypothetical protein